MDTPLTNPTFESLTRSFLTLIGQDPTRASGISGFEFEYDAYSVAVAPIGEAKLIVEVGVTALQPAETASVPLLMALHRLNDSTRGEHGWIATIDDEERLLLSSTFSLAALDAAGLQNAMASAIDRAEVLSAIVARVAADPEDLPAPPTDIQSLRI
jgi:hypothetical protein